MSAGFSASCRSSLLRGTAQPLISGLSFLPLALTAEWGYFLGPSGPRTGLGVDSCAGDGFLHGGGIVQAGKHCFGEGVGVVDFKGEAVAARCFQKGRVVAVDDRCACRHGFQNGESETLFRGGEDEGGCMLIEGRELF